ncbi:MAG: hypothetical protein ACJ781_03685 [Myxococcales bacterium]
MRRTILVLIVPALSACITGSQPAHERDQRLVREIAQQQRWTGEAVAGRPAAEELDAVRSGDADAVSDARKRFRRLLMAVDRTVWIREAEIRAIRDAQGDAIAEDEAVAGFDRAGRQRVDALVAADDLAKALADSKSKRAISLDELRRAMLTVQKAKESEQRLSKELGKAGRSQESPGALTRLTASSGPRGTVFVDATVRYLLNHPDEQYGLDSWTAQLATERSQVRAALADAEASRPQAPAPAPATNVGSAGDDLDRGEQQPPPLPGNAQMSVAGDAKKLIDKRGTPKAILTREGGLFALRYDEERPCGIDRCQSTVDYVFDSSGKLIRDEVVSQQK